MLKTGLILFSLLAVTSQLLFANADISKQDSVINKKYPFVFPIWGAAAAERGYSLPLPHGIMSNTLFNSQDLLISDLKISLGDNELVPIDFVEFGKVNAKVITSNIRADTWVLPFLNVYGFGGYLSAQMDVSIIDPIKLTTNITNSGTYYGFGALAAAKAGPIFITVDYNFAWTNMELLKKPTLARIAGIRVGHRIASKKKAQSNFAFWAGAMNQQLASNTVGRITLSDALDLSDQNIKELVGLILGDIANPQDTKVNYSIKKELKSKWNGLIGAQYQFNDKWQLLGELGFGSKQQALVSLNYRFGIKGKTLKSKKQ